MIIDFFNNVSRTDERSLVIGRTCAFDVKKVLDSQLLILVTRGGKKSKKIFVKMDFCSYLLAHLIDFF